MQNVTPIAKFCAKTSVMFLQEHNVDFDVPVLKSFAVGFEARLQITKWKMCSFRNTSAIRELPPGTGLTEDFSGHVSWRNTLGVL